MTTITINHIEETWDCECCGPVYDEQLIISRDGEELCSYLHDGHFGNGDNIRDPIVVLQNVLKVLGYTVEVINDENSA